MIRITVTSAAAFFGAAAFAFAGDAGDPGASCGNSTYEMVACFGAQTAQWDKKMNAAYQELLKNTDGKKQRDQLRAAQRLWIQYRDANCLYYALGEGTIARVEAATCMRDMTKARARELSGSDTPSADKPGGEDRD